VRYIQRVGRRRHHRGQPSTTWPAPTDGGHGTLNVKLFGNGPLTLFTGGSAYHYSSDAANLRRPNLSHQGSGVGRPRANATWEVSRRWTRPFRMFAKFTARPYATEGGSRRRFVFLETWRLRRKSLWGGIQGSVAVRVADPFNLMSYGFRTADGSG